MFDVGRLAWAGGGDGVGWRVEDGHGDVVAAGGAVVEGCRVTTGDGGGRVAGVGTRVGGVGAGHSAEVRHDFGMVAGNGASEAVGAGQDTRMRAIMRPAVVMVALPSSSRRMVSPLMAFRILVRWGR